MQRIESYKRANRIMKEKLKERKNKIWEAKCREVDNMIRYLAIDRSMAFSKESANSKGFPDFRISNILGYI